MAQDTNVENLIINKLTKAQFESITTPDPTQLYFITDEGESISTLDDVSLNDIANGQILKYNATTQKWENSTIGGGTWGSITGTLSDQTDLQDALDAKQATLVSGTNIKTLNGNSILGSGNLTLDGLPTQTGQSGKFLTTDGTDASWGNLPIATASTIGVVKPDNASIRVSNDGTISAICRNVGEIISSTLPLTDAGLHLLDGALLPYGIYKEFIDYIADLYNNTPAENVYNVNIVGSLTNNNGVLSGFAAGVYATIEEVPYSTADSIEILLKTTTGTLDTSNFNCFYSPVVSNFRGVNLQITPDNKIQLYVSSNAGSSWDIVDGVVGTTILQSNTQYYFKYVYTGTNHILYMSTTGAFTGEETTEVNVTNSSKPSNSAVSLGLQAWATTQNVSYWRGSIDLNESYININGKRWWSGKTERRAGFLTEEQWQATVTTYGVCGKFVYDSTNNTVRLPKVTGIIEGTTDATALGDLVEAGLPNITGNPNMIVTGNAGANSTGGTGCVSVGYHTLVNGGLQEVNQGRALCSNWDIDASRSSSLYKNNFNKVQPQAIKVLCYIVIANSTKTEIQVDIDQVATDLNGKADTDLSNVTDTAKVMMSGMAMPSDKYINLTLGASGSTYTAPANGYFYLNKVAGSDWYYIDIAKAGSHDIFDSDYRTSPLTILFPVKKNDIVTITYNATGTTNAFRFIYAQGSESEAS